MAQPGSALDSPFRIPAGEPAPPSVVPADVAALQEEIKLLAELKSRVEGNLAQLQIANARLAADEMIHRQRLITAQAFIQAVLQSPIWKVTAPIRFLRSLLRPRGCTTQHLLPEQDLEPAPGELAGTWRACGYDPQFLVRLWMPPGWVRFRVHLHSPEPTQFDLFADYGAGFSESTCIERQGYKGDVHAEFFVLLEKPIFALRLDPRDSQGVVRLIAFEALPVPQPRFFLSRLRETLQQARASRRSGRSLLGLLADLRHGKLTAAPARPQKKSQENLRDEEYHEWFVRQRPSEAERGEMRDEAATWFQEPVLFSVLVPVHEVPEQFLRAAIESVRRQIYPHWELCLAIDGLKSTELRCLLEEYERNDERIRVVFLDENRGVSAATNAALEIARGDFIALLDHDDEFAEDALWQIARSLSANADADMLYSDEDKLTLEGKHVQPHFKPGWSPELLLSYMYTCHLGVYRTALVRQLGGFRTEFDQAQDYDLALRVARGGRVRHVPGVLYHWRMLPTSTSTSAAAKPRAHEAARRALEAHLAQTAQAGRVESGALHGLFRVRFALVGNPLVSIIIPTACSKAIIHERSIYLLANCLATLRRNSTYANVEIIVIDNGDMPDDLKREIANYDVRLLSFDGNLNLSAKLNQGAAAARGEHLLFLNDDTEIINPDWLEALLEYSQQPEIGAVGAKLYFADDCLQHVGVLIEDGRPVHLYHRQAKEHPGYFGSNLVVRNYAAVTGACLMTRADVFRNAGGFDESFVLTHSDIDYCLKLLGSGKRIVFTPHAQLYHFESVSRSAAPGWEAEKFRERWSQALADDPYTNPHLTLAGVDLRFNPYSWLSAARARQLDHLGAPSTTREVLRAGIDLGQAAAAEVAWGESGAARWVLNLLLENPELRTRFPRALTGGPGGEFAQWALAAYLQEPEASSTGATHLEAVFKAPPGNVVRQIYEHTIEVRRKYPLAETPGGRWQFLRWLLSCGMARERLTLEQVLWFFLEAEEDPATKLLRAYRINPEWQERYPLALTCFGRTDFLCAFGEEHGLEEAAWFRELDLPDTHSPLEELKLLYAERSDLRTQHPEAFEDDHRLAEMVASLPQVDESWLARLQDEVGRGALQRPGVNLFGHYCYASGLNVALNSTDATLTQLGAAIARRDVPCEPRNHVKPRDAFLDLEIHDVTLLHVAPEPLLDYFYPLSGLRRRPGVARVAVWFWELESAPAAWKSHARHLEEIWAPTRFIARALEAVMPKPVIWMPPGLSLPPFESRPRAAFNLQNEKFLFLSMFDLTSGIERKNPFAAIEAFRKAFRPEDPVRLVLKTSRGSYQKERFARLQELARAAGRVTILDDILTRSDTYALMANADAYVSLHRSEGFGLTLAEAMLLGKPVVATGYSGNMDFMTAENSYLVDYQMTPITDNLQTYGRGFCWAEPSVAHAAQQMRSVYDDSARARAVGERARTDVQRTLDPKAAGQRMLERLQHLKRNRKS